MSFQQQEEHFLMLKLIRCFFLPLFSFFIHNASASNSTSSSTVCRPYSCADGLQIRYPFWLSHGSPPDQYCGYQEFGLICSDGGYPIFSLPPGLYYRVAGIDYDNHIIHLIDLDTYNRTCPRALHNVPLGNLPLSHSPLNLNLGFHYNCSSYPYNASPIRCLTSGAKQSFVFVMGNESTRDFDWSKTCEQSVVVTVMKDHVTSEGLMNEYKEAMNEGFFLNWQTAKSCEECEASDGICGYSNTRKQSLCFCKDGSVQSNSCSGRRKGHLSKLTIGLIAAGAGALLICIIIFFLRRKISLIISVNSWKVKKNDEAIEAFIRNNGPLTITRYTFSEVKKMTNSFEVKLGEGGYGTVFKGSALDSCPVAVKVLNASKGNGEEFINEVVSISRTSHVNIVTLLGFCVEGSKKALVYELMPNGSLEKFICKRDLEPNDPPLSWEKLLQIAEGIAKGLEYLHRGCSTRILHFDIKPNNILLDKNLCPKISDFGLAKLCSKTRSIVSMLDARGTVGYIAPEVWNRNFGGVSHKSDVYSYGMLILEMVGGRQNINRDMNDSSDIYFPHLLYNQIEIDKNITEHDGMTREESEIAKKMIMVGLWCVQTMPSDRPPMNRVIEMLEGSLDQLPVPPKPFMFPPIIPTTSREESCATNGVLSFSVDYQCGR
ncbi:LEAF RUST 10 DISEASE-RESISTANCE LOCUS RECEPTOR-LIKE PROTEIN KINASE-like 2.3 [Neltuma alba]|uniref:LEAF RUST 10 DISEASE-RESISTANCE LOCUS RECEPTOR-LIKE PROTEIN KINASE-like 2.3 n=1 Tax=Neltuma alba TaxID=207710 RepID=UPI0010A4F185|nr:LEAF RUST 10 DISEASE-RESISTANCE LOCUS RECEPTOR-LIKE PROTEIN KINASE-like 2.3 [Prosopis alba]